MGGQQQNKGYRLGLVCLLGLLFIYNASLQFLLQTKEKQNKGVAPPDMMYACKQSLDEIKPGEGPKYVTIKCESGGAVVLDADHTEAQAEEGKH